MKTKAIIEALIETGGNYSHYGLPVFEIDGCEYAIGDDEQAQAAAKESIEQSVWAFNASFLCSYIAGGELSAEDIERLRGDRCEDCNDAFLKLIDDFDQFAEDAICADGRGHFLSTYDGDEVELDGYYFYRV